MLPLSPEQEQQLVEALVSLDWMTNHERKSCTVIREHLGCTMAEAVDVLKYIYRTRKLIRPISPTDQETRDVFAGKSRWKWERGLRSRRQ